MFSPSVIIDDRDLVRSSDAITHSIVTVMVTCVKENLLGVVKGAVRSRFAIGKHSNAITKAITDSLGLFASWGYLERVLGFPVVQLSGVQI